MLVYIDRMDWLRDFIERFESYPEIRDLKAREFHGKLEINFYDGISANYNITQHRKANTAHNKD